MKKITWYRKWHQWELHSHAHASVLVVYLFVVAASLLFFYQQAYAAQSTQSWDFSNAAEFEFDDTKVETIGTSARLKAQNYSNDAQTAALYHFDELNGSSVTDSSSNGNNGTITDATFNSGVLNNSLEFNGTTSAVTIPDSLSLSFGQQNTLEAWTKFNTSFSAGSDTQRQTIIDKGDYQLYYNNETGKVSYELADRNSDEDRNAYSELVDRPMILVESMTDDQITTGLRTYAIDDALKQSGVEGGAMFIQSNASGSAEFNNHIRNVGQVLGLETSLHRDHAVSRAEQRIRQEKHYRGGHYTFTQPLGLSLAAQRMYVANGYLAPGSRISAAEEAILDELEGDGL